MGHFMFKMEVHSKMSSHVMPRHVTSGHIRSSHAKPKVKAGIGCKTLQLEQRHNCRITQHEQHTEEQPAAGA